MGKEGPSNREKWAPNGKRGFLNRQRGAQNRTRGAQNGQRGAPQMGKEGPRTGLRRKVGYVGAEEPSLPSLIELWAKSQPPDISTDLKHFFREK